MAAPEQIEFIDSEDSPNPMHVTDELVREVERFLGARLPNAYVSLMKRHNGGYIPEHLVKVESPVLPPFEDYLGDGFACVGSIAGISLDPDGEASIARSIYLIEEWNLPKGLVLLDGDGPTWIALDYRQSEMNPPVIFVISESGHHLNLASDFEDFIARLIPFGDLYDPNGNLK